VLNAEAACSKQVDDARNLRAAEIEQMSGWEQRTCMGWTCHGLPPAARTAESAGAAGAMVKVAAERALEGAR
jgi:hypothetical protein